MTIIDIQKMVADFYGIKVEAMKGRTKIHDIVVPRQISVYLCSIAKVDRQSAILTAHGLSHRYGTIRTVDVINNACDCYPETRKEIEAFKKILNVKDKYDNKRSIIRELSDVRNVILDDQIRNKISAIIKKVEECL